MLGLEEPEGPKGEGSFFWKRKQVCFPETETIGFGVSGEAARLVVFSETETTGSGDFDRKGSNFYSAAPPGSPNGNITPLSGSHPRPAGGVRAHSIVGALLHATSAA